MEPRVAEPHEGGNVGDFFSLPRLGEREICDSAPAAQAACQDLNQAVDIHHVSTHMCNHTHTQHTAAESSGHRGRTI